MNQDDNVKDALDARLSRLFAEKNEPLSADGFMIELLSRLERAHRTQQIRRILLLVVVLLLAALLAPLAARMTMGLFSVVGQGAQLPGVDVVITAGPALIAGVMFFRARRWA